jgi:conjugal transfer pilus assembly protein TraI
MEGFKVIIEFLRKIIGFLRSVFGSNSPSTSGLIAVKGSGFNPDPDYAVSMQDVPRYPPFDRGLPNISVDELLKSQKTLVDRVKESGLPFADQAVRNLAAYVHLLPATSNDFFCGAGGLFRLCLEIGFHSYIASQGNIFTSRDPAEKRRELEAKWHLAAFLAGLCCELSRAIVTSVVTNDHGEQWLPFEPITGWLQRTNGHRYFLRPPQTPTSPMQDTAHLSGVIVNAIIPSEALQHITTDDRTILMAMLSTITQLTAQYNSGQFPRAVRHVRDQVIQRDQQSNPLTFGKPLVGVHVEPYLINGMRHLVRNGQWKINQKLARVHLAPDGAFVFWSTGVAEILTMLRDEGAVGLPTDPRTLGEWLMASGVFEANAEGGLWWYIRTPLSEAVYEVVKLSSAALILEDEVLSTVTAYPGAIVVDPATMKTPVVKGSQVEPKDLQPVKVVPGVVVAETVPSEPTEPSADNSVTQVQPLSQPPSVKPASAPEDSNAVVVRDYGKALAMSANNPPSQDKAPVKSQPAQPPKAGARKDPPTGGPKTATQKGGKKAPQDAPSQALLPLAATPVAQPSESRVDTVGAILKRPSQVNDMHVLIELHNKSDPSPMFWISSGLAIPMVTLQNTVDHGPLIMALQEVACIYLAPGQTHKFHILVHEGQELRCLVIIKHKALEFGFKGPVDVVEQEPQSIEETV